MNNFYSLAYQHGEILFDYSELINVNKPLQQISFAIQQSCDSEQKSQKIFIVIGLTDKSNNEYSNRVFLYFHYKYFYTNGLKTNEKNGSIG